MTDNANEHQQTSLPVFATMVGEINQASAASLTRSVSLMTQNGFPELHLLLQSTGGTVSEGVYLYNFLRLMRIKTHIYNVGSIASAAALLYLGASSRIASQHSTFMIHRPQSPSQGGNSPYLAAATESLALDDRRMDAIVRKHLTLSDERWRVYEHNYLWLSAEDALASGMATAIGDFAPPIGASVFVFGA